MHYRIRFHPDAQRAMRRLPSHVRQRFVCLVESLAADPRPAEALELHDLPGVFRIRMDRWRLVYQVREDATDVVILRAGLKTGPEFYENIPEV